MITKDKERADLLAAFRHLNPANKLTLIQFAKFLQSQQTEGEKPISQEPLDLPKPADESAVKALKRLKRSYPMIDADMSLLDDASRLLMEKITGTPDQEVIEKLEALFVERFKSWQLEQE
ncbi:MAG: Crp/Fnr family transcriptional regulator [Magnetococcales bacterium]|nr:Crp/Fnr family transcriptional regulator [Magnetococcales bacterium]